MKKLRKLFLLVLIIAILCEACQVQKIDTSKKKELDYTIVPREELPEDFLKQIEATQDIEFNLTYDDNEYLYIAQGYGEQKTGGFSVKMMNLYTSENTLYFESELWGPKAGENVDKAHSYPYIVVKLESIKLPVVFL